MISQIRVSITADCFAGQTALVTLKLNQCGLTAIPKALVGLAGSLTSLELSYHRNLQLVHDDVMTLLALRNLQKLKLYKPYYDPPGEVMPHQGFNDAVARYGGELVLWTRRSMQHLVKLAVAFYVQHGRELALHLFEEEDIDA